MSHRHVGFRPERAADRVRVRAGFTRQTQPVVVVVPNDDGLLRFGKKVFPPRLDGEHAPAGWTKRQHGGRRGGDDGGVFSPSTFTNTASDVASPVPSSSTGVNDDGDDDDVVVVLS